MNYDSIIYTNITNLGGILCRKKINTMCSCKNLKCKIHGNCKECIDHHKEHGQPHCKRPENLEAVKEMRKLPFIIC